MVDKSSYGKSFQTCVAWYRYDYREPRTLDGVRTVTRYTHNSIPVLVLLMNWTTEDKGELPVPGSVSFVQPFLVLRYSCDNSLKCI